MHRSVPYYRVLASACCVLAGVVLRAFPAYADTVTLLGGDVLTGEVVEENETSIVLEHKDLGTVIIPRSALAPERAAATGAEEAVVRSSGLFGTQLFDGWTHQLEAGINGSEGNSEDLSFRVALKSDYEDERHRWNVLHSYYRASSAGTMSANEFAAAVTKDWLLPESPWFIFARTRYDYDEFKDWTHRVSAYGGVGRQLIQNDQWDVVARLGAGATREFGSSDTSIQPDGLLGVEATYTISDRSSIVATSTAYPLLDDLEIRVISTAEWSAAVTNDGRIRIKLGVSHEYESEVDPGIDPHDIKYYGTLVVDL